jgi:hypothetical protein
MINAVVTPLQESTRHTLEGVREKYPCHSSLGSGFRTDKIQDRNKK